MNLFNIKDSVQKISDAISLALKCQVTIVDNNLNRITGTGLYKETSKYNVPKGSAFNYVLQTKETVLIENPGHDEMCYNCEKKMDCPETYEICCPIIWNNNILGIIGIFAFNKKQREFLRTNNKNLLIFLKKMAELIGSKIGESILFDNIQTHNKELNLIIENFDNGVICVDKTGNINNINNNALKILGINEKKENVLNNNINSYIDNSLIMQGINEEKEFTNKQEYCQTSSTKKSVLTTLKLIKDSAGIKSAVGTFSDLENIQKSVFRLNQESHHVSFDSILGDSMAMKKVKKRSVKVADNNSTILIRGDSGTGKELFARAIHNESQRRNLPFVSINCSAIPEALLESELFGYEGGSFTGAKQNGKIGKFELANLGTFFLDEIGDMPLYLQAKLLRVLQNKQINRIGGLNPIDIDVRIISATNRNLEELIEKKIFREDLYYRLNVIPLSIPSLSERIEDISILIDYFINIYNKRLNKNIKGFSDDALNFLMNHHWPGNVRELENVVEYGINFVDDGFIGLSDIEERFEKKSNSTSQSLKTMTFNYEKKIIIEYLNKHGWDEQGKEHVAKLLNISRASIYRKIKD